MTGGTTAFLTGRGAAYGRTLQCPTVKQCARGRKVVKALAALEGRRGEFSSDPRDRPSRFQDWEVQSSSCEASTSSRFDEVDDAESHDDTLTPLPSAVPSGPLPGLMWGLDFNKTYMNCSYVPHYSEPTRIEEMEQVYVILFGEPTSPAEGIYSLRAISREDNLPQDTIIAFAEFDDAVRYAKLLAATMQHTPKVYGIDPSELVAFCSDSGYQCRLEPCGSLLLPPDYNVGITDWERLCSLRMGNFTVLDKEPEYGSHIRSADWGVTTSSLPATGDRSNVVENTAGLYDPSFTWEEPLEEVRSRLERLLALEGKKDPLQ